MRLALYFHLLIGIGGWVGAVGLWIYGLWLYSATRKPMGGMDSAIVMIVLGVGFLIVLILAVPSTLAAAGSRRGWGWAFWLVLLRDIFVTVGLAAATVRNLLPGEGGAEPELQSAAIFGALTALFLTGIVLDIAGIYSGRAAEAARRSGGE